MVTITKFVFLFMLFYLATAAKKAGKKWTTEDVQKTEVRELANEAAYNINRASNSIYYSKLIEVKTARSQTVVNRGTRYKLTLTVGETNCRKSASNLSNCTVTRTQSCRVVGPNPTPRNGKGFECGKFKAVTPKKQSSKSDRVVVGGPKEIQLSDSVKQMATFAMDKFNAKSDSNSRAVVTKYKKITSQVVSGTKYRITVEIGFSQCPNNADHTGHTVEQCPVDANAGLYGECTFSVWSRPWLNDDTSLILDQEDCVSTTKQVKRTKLKKASRQKRSTNIGGDDHDFGSRGAFQNFKAQFDRKYTTAKEEDRRFKIFRQNMKMARKLQKTEEGTATYGATMFADLTRDEFSRYVGKPWNLSPDPTLPQATIPINDIPTSYDWRDHNAVTPVKNQGQCGSCWAFSTTGNIEGIWAVKKKNLVSLSEQELVDCDKLDEGCNGGLPSNAYKEIIRLGGLEPETDYPYKAKDDKCNFQSGDIKVYINGSVNVSKDENEMAQYLVANGPLSVGINANAMQWYMGGISHPWSLFCNPGSLDHGVLITGYGVEKGVPFWSIKNSWGTSWGEKGYYRVFKGAGVCGLNQMVTSSVIN